MEYSTALQGLAGYRPTASVSAVIPTLNEEKLIERTLLALKEYAPGAEIVVVDGGSTDATYSLYYHHLKDVIPLGTL